MYSQVIAVWIEACVSPVTQSNSAGSYGIAFLL